MQYGWVSCRSRRQVFLWAWSPTLLHIDLLDIVCHRLSLSSLFSDFHLLTLWDVWRLFYLFEFRSPNSRLFSSAWNEEIWGSFAKKIKSTGIQCLHVWGLSMNFWTRNAPDFNVDLNSRWRRISFIVLTSFQSSDFCFAELLIPPSKLKVRIYIMAHYRLFCLFPVWRDLSSGNYANRWRRWSDTKNIISEQRKASFWFFRLQTLLPHTCLGLRKFLRWSFIGRYMYIST